MKKLLLAALFAAGSLTVSADIIHLDLSSITVPNTIDGIYLNILTGATTFTYPADFNTKPWINLYLGGTGISNSDLLRPWANQAPEVYDGSTAGNYFVNLASGTTIGSSGVFVSGEASSEFHVGAGTDQFHSGTKGVLAFTYESALGGSTSYGWISFAPNSGGTGVAYDLAYTNTAGETLSAGLPIPEPSTYAILAGAMVLGVAVVSRRRRSA